MATVKNLLYFDILYNKITSHIILNITDEKHCKLLKVCDSKIKFLDDKICILF